jgi:cytochrome oxidase assembly protein ShyY1
VRFRPRPVPTVAALSVALVCGALARWQLGRDVERNAGRRAALAVEGLPVLTELAAPTAPWRMVALDGAFEGPPLLESGRVEETPGYGLLRAFRTAGGFVVLADLGWLAPEDIAARMAGPWPAHVEGQLRPLRGDPGTRPLAERDGARVYPPGATRAMRPEGGVDAVAVMGARGVPSDDPTSRWYAVQWAGIGIVGLGLWVAASRVPGAERADQQRGDAQHQPGRDPVRPHGPA